MKLLPTLFAFSLIASVEPMDCTPDPGPTPEVDENPEPELDPELQKNPLVRPSTQPFAAPEFGLIEVGHFLPALEYGAKLQTYHVKRIANLHEAPTFENTIVPLEQSGHLFGKTIRILRTMTRSSNDPALLALDQKASEMDSAQDSAMHQNAKLYARVKTLHDHRASLSEDQRRLVEDRYDRFVRSGAGLDAAQQATLRGLNADLAQKGTTFGQNLATMIENDVVIVENKDRLAGLTDSQIDTLAQAATDAGHDGKYLIRLVNTTRHPLLTQLQNRELRKKLWERSAKRGLAVNGPVAQAIAQGRDQKAKLLGYKDWAQLTLDKQLAKDSKGVFDRLSPIAQKIVTKTKAEAKKLKKVMEDDGAFHEIEPWDWFYYAEKVRAQDFEFDANELKPYFELDRVREDGVFFTMQQLFGVTFHERKDIPVYHPDVRAFEVKDENGASLGLLYTDDFTRNGKRGGVWINTWSVPNRSLNEKALILTNFSLRKPAGDAPVLLSFREVENLFYATGYAVQALLLDIDYPSQASERLPRDFSGFPAQFFTYCAQHPTVLANFAKHHESGEALPEALMTKMMNARSFNRGFNTLEYLKAAYLDLEWHTDLTKQDVSNIESFENQCFEKHKLSMEMVPPRYKSSYFSHIFFSDYSAGYYSYLWNEIYASDAFAFMEERGGLNRENGDRLRRLVLSRGSSVDPSTQYLDFRGQAPSVDPYLARLGIK